MYLFEYLIYHVNPYGSAQVRHHLQSTPAPPPDASLKVVGTFFSSRLSCRDLNEVHDPFDYRAPPSAKNITLWPISGWK